MKTETLDALRKQAECRHALEAHVKDNPNLEPDSEEHKRHIELRDALFEANAAVRSAWGDETEAAGAETTEPEERCELSTYLNCRAMERKLEGAEAELNKELGLTEEQIPMQALLERADAISPQDAAGSALDSGDISNTRAPILRRVFGATDTAFLGIGMPMVPPGKRTYPVMVDGTTASMQARGGKPDAGAAKFGVVTATPKRITSRYVFDLEGVAELGGELEMVLRADMRAALGFALDLQLLTGSGAAPNVTGLLKQLDLTLPPGAPAGKDAPQLSWANFKQIFTQGLDAKYARTEADIRALIGSVTYSTARGLYRNANAGDARDAIAEARALGSAVRRSFQLPAPAQVTVKGQGASTKKHESMIVNSEPGAAIAPVWQGITAIRDPYSNAGEAQVVLTIHMLFDFVMRRKDGWHQYAINPTNAAV